MLPPVKASAGVECGVTDPEALFTLATIVRSPADADEDVEEGHAVAEQKHAQYRLEVMIYRHKVRGLHRSCTSHIGPTDGRESSRQDTMPYWQCTAWGSRGCTFGVTLAVGAANVSRGTAKVTVARRCV